MDSRVEQWRFDRVLFRTQHCWRESETAGQDAVRIATVKLCDNSFAVDFNAAPSDHAFVQASFAVLAGGTTDARVLEERLQVLRPGLGPQVCRRPGAKEKCAQQRHGQTVCGKDYEKARMSPGAGCHSGRFEAQSVVSVVHAKKLSSFEHTRSPKGYGPGGERR